MKEPKSDPSTSRLAKTRTVIEGVLLVIGIPTAIVTFLALFPQAWEFTHQRAQQYETLRGLHAGYTLEKFKAELGEPTLSASNGPLTQYTFLASIFHRAVDRAWSASSPGLFC